MHLLAGLLALTFLTTGVSKLASIPPSPENFARWGYSPSFMLAIGAVEVLGGVALLVPRVSAVAAAALLVTMLGALRTGIVHGEPLHVALPLVLVVLLSILAYARREPLLRAIGRGER
jgi:putative oxidoreductase